jgi:uncharacterized membrane protein (UPF0127 family)
MDRLILEGDRGTHLIVDVTRSRTERMRGLLCRDGLASGHGLLIPNARSIHTFGMRFPIEVAFLDETMKVVAVRRMRPGRLGRPRIRARHVLECALGEGPSPEERLTVPVGARAGADILIPAPGR